MIKIKSATQIEQMKKAGALSKMALRHVGAMVRPGVSTFELDQLAEQIIRMHGGTRLELVTSSLPTKCSTD